GFRTGSSNHTTISSTIVARPGTSSSISRGASCLSDCVNGRTSSDQWDSVLGPQGALACRTRACDSDVVSGSSQVDLGQRRCVDGCSLVPIEQHNSAAISVRAYDRADTVSEFRASRVHAYRLAYAQRLALILG